MNHITNNINIRRAQLGISVTQMEQASDISRQQLHNVISNPEKAMFRSLQKIALLLYCPVELLLQADPSEVVNYPMPPEGYLTVICSNLQKFGFNGGNVITVEELREYMNTTSRPAFA
jgi:hypothetical protein